MMMSAVNLVVSSKTAESVVEIKLVHCFGERAEDPFLVGLIWIDLQNWRSSGEAKEKGEMYPI